MRGRSSNWSGRPPWAYEPSCCQTSSYASRPLVVAFSPARISAPGSSPVERWLSCQPPPTTARPRPCLRTPAFVLRWRLAGRSPTPSRPRSLRVALARRSLSNSFPPTVAEGGPRSPPPLKFPPPGVGPRASPTSSVHAAASEGHLSERWLSGHRRHRSRSAANARSRSGRSRPPLSTARLHCWKTVSSYYRAPSPPSTVCLLHLLIAVHPPTPTSNLEYIF